MPVTPESGFTLGLCPESVGGGPLGRRREVGSGRGLGVRFCVSLCVVEEDPRLPSDLRSVLLGVRGRVLLTGPPPRPFQLSSPLYQV